MELIIVESPSKAKTISKYLEGGKYRVMATGGHVRDLPTRTLGVNVNGNFEPEYEITPAKKEVINGLTAETKKASRVYLATDPDREGEAISWHLQEVLGLPEDAEDRIEFNEISKKAVENALLHPRKINRNLVDAQQARRVLDRLVGYRLSPLLDRHIQYDEGNLSAGRVQSVALRLIVDREREIQAFKPEDYWNFTADLSAEKGTFSALYQLKKTGRSITDDEAAEKEKGLKAAEYVVTKVKSGTSKRHAPAPFTTSSLQQESSSRLGYTAPDTMRIAQDLYEGMDTESGHNAYITYLRTDSVRVSADAQREAREFIGKTYGDAYVPAKPNIYSSKKDIQDAHEAIRPINLDVTPDSVKNSMDRKHYSLYKLIYDRFVASQMCEAVYDTMNVEVTADRCVFKASGKTVKFRGYEAAYSACAPASPDGDGDESSQLFPPLKEGDVLGLRCLTKEKKHTSPPARYTDASLVKTMDENGIGRPSTYASIISVLTKRRYVVKDGKSMVPTEIAYSITDLLTKYFKDLMDVQFTAKMESDLDRIEDGGTDWHSYIADFYPSLQENIKAARNEGVEETDVKCSKCGSPMLMRTGRDGTKYLACSAFPKCRNTVSADPPEYTDVMCEKCGAPMIKRVGKYGPYLACSAYPKCSNIVSADPPEYTDVKCKKCGAPMVRRTGKYGPYLACSAYPRCRNIVRDTAAGGRGAGEKASPAETPIACPKCGAPMVKRTGRYGEFISCSAYPKCRMSLPADAEILEEKCGCGGTLIKETKRGKTYTECVMCGKKTYLGDAPVPEKSAETWTCPDCGAPVVRKYSRKGSPFYGCSRYPECSFASSDPPAGGKCPRCGGYLVLRGGRAVCAAAGCGYTEENTASPF